MQIENYHFTILKRNNQIRSMNQYLTHKISTKWVYYKDDERKIVVNSGRNEP